jgi:DNA (cytosine-5)-methyltransferase 1
VKRSQLKELEETLLNEDWLSVEPDAKAVVGHFLRNPFEKPPRTTLAQYRGLKSVANRTIARLKSTVCEDGVQLLSEIVVGPSNFPSPNDPKFKFIDLFAGIGGFRIAFQEAGGRCVFTSEWDKFAQKTYERNFGDFPYGDITRIDEKDIPEHDVLCAGFPCQPFSLAGVSKKNSLGRKHGFDDETQGTLFFDVKRILKHHRPKAFMLENVKNLLSHDKGRTFEVIRKSLVDELGYTVTWKVVNGGNWVPQNRQRIFIVGFNPDTVSIDEDDINIPTGPRPSYEFIELNRIIQSKVDGHTLGPGTWDTLIRHKANHAKKGNGFGYGLHTVPIPDGAATRTISARYHKDGAEVLIEQPGRRPRRLTVQEAMQLQGYKPEKFVFPVSNTQAYRQIGNSVVVPAVSACAGEIARVILQMR